MKTFYPFVSACFLLISQLGFSQSWNGTISSDWNTAANWTPNNVPGTSSTVTINNAAATHQPVLAGNVNIASLNMSQGILNLAGFNLTCSGHAILTGDSLFNGKITALTFDNVANMHMGGKIILEKTGASNEFWAGNNKFYGDSMNITWRSGALHLENATSSPDSIFGNMKVQLANNYSVYFSLNSNLYVQNNLILDNAGNGTFFLNSSNNIVIGGSLVGQNFSSLVPNFPLSNVTALGTNPNGPFYCHSSTVDNCYFNGNFTLVTDSNVTVSIHNSAFLGADNLLQAGNFDAYGNRFGKSGNGTTILRAALNLNSNVYMRTGNNKFIGNAQWETYAVYPAGVTMQHNWYGADTSLQNLSFILKGNAALTTNNNGNNYVAGNVVIDGQGARKWIEFTGGTGNSFTIGGNFTVKNFTPFAEPGIGITNVYLRNVYASGTDTCGTIYCYTGDINGSSFNGNFKIIADSSQGYFVNNSSFLGSDNLFQAGIMQAQNSQFGQVGTGTTILRSALSSGSNYMRDGLNKFFNNIQWETYAVYPAGVTIQQNYFGVDSCWGNMNFILKGNAALTTNGSGNNYVAGNVTIDGQGARKWVQFTGGAGNTFNVGGNFTVKNFTPFSEPGVGTTNVYLRNLFVTGSDTVGTFYCYTGDINGSNFNGNFKIIADSSQGYVVNNSSFLGADNLFQAGIVETQNNRFGQVGSGTTILRSALSTGSNYMRDGLNKFFNNAQWETYAAYPNGVTIQQTFYGADSCMGNMNFVLKGNSALTTNGSGNNFVAGNVTIDGQGARKWVQFTGGAGVSFNVGGNFTVKNFTPFSEPGVGTTNVHLRNLYVAGVDTVGTFYCYSGDINSSSFNGNFKIIADSSQGYVVNNSSFLGADNLFQAGIVETQNNKFGQIGPGTTILRSALSSGSNLMSDGNNKFFNNAQWEAYALSPGSILIQQTFFGPDSCLGNLAINLEGTSSANLAGNNLYIGKGLSISNNGSGTVGHDNVGSNIVFTGTDTSDYSFTGSGSSPSILNIIMNRKGGLRLLSPLTCSGTITFTRGIILSSSANPLQIPNGAVVSAAWDSGYVDGPVKKTGNVGFTFPLGKNNVYAPIGITAPTLTTDAFTAQYFNHIAQSDGYDSTQHDISLDHVSRKEYWMLDRTAGTSPAQVTLSWKTLRSGEVNAMSDLRVARWNGATWKDEGNGGTTGTNTEGTIQSFNVINSFSPFTLASTGLTNLLPVKYISFDVVLNANRQVLVRWKTADEINNDHFEVERSKDGMNWTNLSFIRLQSSNDYAYTDMLPNEGANYYRIKEVDINGKYFYTPVRTVQLMNETKVFIWPNPASDELHVQMPYVKGTMDITDMTGRVIWKNTITSNSEVISIKQLGAGIYVLRIKYSDKTYVEKFVKE